MAGVAPQLAEIRVEGKEFLRASPVPRTASVVRAAIGPLAVKLDPHAHDLCAIHTERLSVPKGWVVVRHETLQV